MPSSLAERFQPDKPKLLDRVREVCRFRHYSIRTEQAYVDWVKRYILFHNKRHPDELEEDEVRALLTHLAVSGRVSALLFLYDAVLQQPLGWIKSRTT